MRLTKDQKEQLHRNLTANLHRAPETVVNPLENYSDEFLLGVVNTGITPELLDAVQLVSAWGQQHNESRCRDIATRKVNIVALDDEGESLAGFTWNSPEPVLRGRITLGEDTKFVELREDILTYSTQREYADRLGDVARLWLRNAIDACSSAGQVRRMLPEFVPLFSKDVQQALLRAQRASRMPQEFPENWYKRRLAANMVTMLSLLPKERKEMPYLDSGYAMRKKLNEMVQQRVRMFEWQPNTDDLPWTHDTT